MYLSTGKHSPKYLAILLSSKISSSSYRDILSHTKQRGTDHLKKRRKYSFSIRYRLIDMLAVMAIVVLAFATYRQKAQITYLQRYSQSLSDALGFETSVLIEYERYQLFRLEDGKIIAVKVEAPLTESIENDTRACIPLRWAMIESSESGAESASQLSQVFQTIDVPGNTMAQDTRDGGKELLGESCGGRLVAGPLSIGWSRRSANSGWLNLNDTLGRAVFMYTEQPKSLDNLRLSPLQWRPVYWTTNFHDRQGWDHFWQPHNLISEWEEMSK
ncbi:hypothetical protein [Pseudobythopirellula maris]|uniref:hypothetical protein n=1 Tax=Pseudobythopirellula maris TaxID=2527991 RepID=UPI0018D30682|nr:hypothetical protein [Pseudobythopirellula maris]